MNGFLTIQNPKLNAADTAQPIAMNGSESKSGSDVFGLLFQKMTSLNLKDNTIEGLRTEAAENDSAMPHETDESIKSIKRFLPNNQQGIRSLKSPLKKTEWKEENPETRIKPVAGHPKDKRIEGLRAETADNDAAMQNETGESIQGIKRFLPNNQQGITFLKSPLKEPGQKGENPEIQIKPSAAHPKDKRIERPRVEAADNDAAMQNETDESIQGIKRFRPNSQQRIHFLKSPLKATGGKGENPEIQIKPSAGHPKDKRIEGLRVETADNDAAMQNETDESIPGIKRFRPNSQQRMHFLKSPLKATGGKGENPEIQIKPSASRLKDKRIEGLRVETADNDAAMQNEADESMKGIKRSRPHRQHGIPFQKSPLKEPGQKGKNPEIKTNPAAGHPKGKNLEGLRAETADNDAAMRNETDESMKEIKRSLPNNHQGINFLKSRLKETRRKAENPEFNIKPAAGHPKAKRIEGLRTEAADNDSTMSHETDESMKEIKRSRTTSQQGIHFLKSRLKELGLKVENLEIIIKQEALETARKKPTHSTEMGKETNKWKISQKQAATGFLDPLAKISQQSKKPVKIRAPRDERQSEKGGETNYASENSSKLSSQTEESSWSSEQGNSFLREKDFFESLKKQNVINNIQNVSGLLDKGLANEKVMAPSHTKEAHILNLIQQISKMTEQLAIATTQKLEVEVEVAKLGKLMVDVTKSNNKINLQIQVENEEAKKWLQHQMSTLHERLTNQGVEIDKLNINLISDHSGSDAGEKAFTGAGPDNRAQPFLLNKTQNASHDSMPSHLLQRNFGYNTVEVWA